MSLEQDFESVRHVVLTADEEGMGDCRPMDMPLVQMLNLVRTRPVGDPSLPNSSRG